MRVLLQIDFPFKGPFGKEMSEALVQLAESICHEPGFVWKIWTENATEKTAGGIYVFETEESAKAYAQKHSARLTSFGVTDIRCRLFSINAPLSTLNRAPESCLS